MVKIYNGRITSQKCSLYRLSGAMFVFFSFSQSRGGGESAGGEKGVAGMLESHRIRRMMWGVTGEGGTREAQQWEAP